MKRERIISTNSPAVSILYWCAQITYVNRFPFRGPRFSPCSRTPRLQRVFRRTERIERPQHVPLERVNSGRFRHPKPAAMRRVNR